MKTILCCIVCASVVTGCALTGSSRTPAAQVASRALGHYEGWEDPGTFYLRVHLASGGTGTISRCMIPDTTAMVMPFRWYVDHGKIELRSKHMLGVWRATGWSLRNAQLYRALQITQHGYDWKKECTLVRSTHVTRCRQAVHAQPILPDIGQGRAR